MLHVSISLCDMISNACIMLFLEVNLVLPAFQSAILSVGVRRPVKKMETNLVYIFLSYAPLFVQYCMQN